MSRDFLALFILFKVPVFINRLKLFCKSFVTVNTIERLSEQNDVTEVTVLVVTVLVVTSSNHKSAAPFKNKQCRLEMVSRFIEFFVSFVNYHCNLGFPPSLPFHTDWCCIIRFSTRQLQSSQLLCTNHHCNLRHSLPPNEGIQIVLKGKLNVL